MPRADTIPCAAGAHRVVRGHGDAAGAGAAKLARSRRRAEAVRDDIAAKEIAAGREGVIAPGEPRHLAPTPVSTAATIARSTAATIARIARATGG